MREVTVGDAMTTNLTSRVRANVGELIEEFGYLAFGACAGTENAITEFVERLAGFVIRFGSMRRTRVAGHTLAGYRTPDEVAMNHLVQACSALELFHAAALAHDDIIDESDTRRHNPTLHTGWGDARLGLAAGLLSGDALLVLCARAIDQVGHSIHGQLARFFQDVQLCTVIGEFQDALLEHRRVSTSRQTIATMAVNKTAWYTVTAPMTIAALCANVEQDVLPPLAAAGATYGEAFQLLDDLRGLLSHPENTGKNPLDDLKAGKATLLHHIVANHATTAERQVLQEVYGRHSDDGRNLARYRTLVRTYQDQVESELDSLLRQSRSLLREAQLPDTTITSIEDELISHEGLPGLSRREVAPWRNVSAAH